MLEFFRRILQLIVLLTRSAIERIAQPEPQRVQPTVQLGTEMREVLINSTSKSGIPTIGNVRVSTTLEDSFKSYTKNSSRKNPIVGLCQRLAVYTIRGDRILEFRNRNKRVRLDMMIGRYLPLRTRNRLLDLKDSRWCQIEAMWQAIGLTVLLNAKFDPSFVDFELIRSLQIFKIWFLNTVLSEPRIDLGITHMGKDLKQVSSWFQWYSMDNRENPCPKRLDRFPQNNGSTPTFSWFGGRLADFRRLDRELTDFDIKVLCQIRTFGRSLPCPPKCMVEEGLKETLEVLQTERTTDPAVLADIAFAVRYLSVRLDFKSLPMDSHISVSISGSLESSQEDGGMAVDVHEMFAPYTQPCRSLYSKGKSPYLKDSVFPLWEFGRPRSEQVLFNTFYDCYGQTILRSADLEPLVTSNSLRACDVLYSKNSESHDAKAFRRTDVRYKDLYGPNTGKILLAISSGKLLEYGEFIPMHDNIITIPNGIAIPVWLKKTQVVFHQNIPIPCRILALAEPGFKVRPLTAGLGALMLVLKNMRQMTQLLLARDGRCRIGITTTNKLWAFLKYLSGKKFNTSMFGQSSDYKSATDYIPLDVIRTIWFEFSKHIPKEHPFLVFLQLLWSPRDLREPIRADWKNLGKGPNQLNYSTYTHRCGSFMGEPMSYMTLTVMNLVTEVISQYYFETKEPMFSGMMCIHIPRNNVFVTRSNILTNQEFLDLPELSGHFITIREDPFVTAGDDKLALRYSKERARLSRDASIGVGFVMSTKDGDSHRVMIFCEDHILIVKSNDSKTVELQYIDVIKCRLLTNVNRSHADNRASIFGKGRMLANQLNYLVGPIRTYVLELHMNLFIRSNDKNFIKTTLPWFLPPNCGGIGLEPIEIPKWGYKYINYILYILDIEDWRLRTLTLWKLRRASERLSHGATPRAICLENAYQALETLTYCQDDFDPESKDKVFTEEAISRHMAANNVPFTLFETSSYDWDSIKTYAYTHGFVSFDRLINEVDRIDCFQQMLEAPTKIVRRTVKDWSRKTSRIWKKLRVSLADEPLRTDFKDLSDLEKRVERHAGGFCSQQVIFDLNIYGPSLRIRKVRETRSSALFAENLRRLTEARLAPSPGH